ncbi:hypothetical protein ACVWYH_009682 [Bradyrhizobium sp. GM24.11]
MEIPDYAALRRGYETLRTRRAKHSNLGQGVLQKIFRFTEIRIRRMFRALRPREEGRIAIVTNAGRAAVDVGHIGAKVLQGGQP